MKTLRQYLPGDDVIQLAIRLGLLAFLIYWTFVLLRPFVPVLAWSMLISRGRIDNAWIIGGCIVAFLIQWLFDHHGPDVPARYPKLSTALTASGVRPRPPCFACVQRLCLGHGLS